LSARQYNERVGRFRWPESGHFALSVGLAAPRAFPWECNARPRATGRRRAGAANLVARGERADTGAAAPHTMKTFVATPANRERNWLVVDASGRTLGRLATQIADALRGKRKPEYTPHCDVGDFVIVVNAEKIAVTGNKRADKRYYRHSGYPGGLRSRTLEEMLARRPEEVIRKAVKGMLPRNRLGRAQLTKLKVYAGPDHPHAAQKPKEMEVEA
jgi:large subunit ribosomal protein L13